MCPKARTTGNRVRCRKGGRWTLLLAANSSLRHHSQPGSMFRPKQHSCLFLGALNDLWEKMPTLLSSSFHIHLCSLVLRWRTAFLSYKCYNDWYNISNGRIMLQQEWTNLFRKGPQPYLGLVRGPQAQKSVVYLAA